MPVSMICFDIDGTLISKRHPHLTPALKDALSALRERGILLCLSTGRHHDEIAQLGLDRAFDFDVTISLNGCYCYGAGGVIWDCPIPAQDVRHCLDFLHAHNLPAMLADNELAYVTGVNGTVVEVQESIYSPIPPLRDARRAYTHPVYKLSPYCTEEQVRRMFAGTAHCKLTRWHSRAFDMFNRDGGKASGIGAVAAHFSIPPSDIMAFGDGDNDVEMLDCVGLPVAMGNAESAVKAHAAFVTKSVDEDGVVCALRHFGLL